MFQRRRLVLVDDSTAVELTRNTSHAMYLVLDHYKRSKCKRTLPFRVRLLLAQLFGCTSVITSHTLLGANRYNATTLTAREWDWMTDFAQSVHEYLKFWLRLKPSKRVGKHFIVCYLVLCPLDPKDSSIRKEYVCSITDNSLKALCSRSIPNLSNSNFDRFLMSTSLYKQARSFLALPIDSGSNNMNSGASDPRIPH